jgi:hypothetical protein
MTNHSKHSIKFLAVVLGLVGTLIVALVAGAVAHGGSTLASANDPTADVLARIDSPRIREASVKDGVASVTARASKSDGEGIRSFWYATLASAAIAQKANAHAVNVRVYDESGNQAADETEPVGAGGPDAFAPIDRSSANINQAVRARGAGLGVQLLSIHYMRVYGGIAELVAQVDDASSISGTGGQVVGALLGDLASNARPYLVAVVGRQHQPLLVLGYTPSVGGGIGQGIGWQAPGLDSGAIFGAHTSQSG